MRATNVALMCVFGWIGAACMSTLGDDLGDYAAAGAASSSPAGRADGTNEGEAPSGEDGGGVCAPCTAAVDCAGANHCVRNNRTGEQFCAEPCDGTSCPSGFSCVQIEGAGGRCVPKTGTCADTQATARTASAQSTPQPGDTGGPTGPEGEPFCADRHIVGLSSEPALAGASLEEMRTFSVDAVNHLRAMTGLPALVRDPCLDRIAQAATDAFAADGKAHGYFLDHCMNAAGDYGDACECGWGQENQGGSGGTNVSWKDAVHRPLCSMMGEPEGKGHRKNIQSREWTRIGVGVANRGGMLVWSHEFGR